MQVHCSGDNLAVPYDVNPGDDVTDRKYSPAIHNLRHELKDDQKIIYIGAVGYRSPTGSEHCVQTYGVVRKVSAEAGPNVDSSPLPQCTEEVKPAKLCTHESCDHRVFDGYQKCARHEIEFWKTQAGAWKKAWYALGDSLGRSVWLHYRQGVADARNNNVYTG